MSKSAGKLTKQQRIFADTYLADPELNATRAYQKAYPKASLKASESGASRLLSNAKVAAYIAKAMEDRSERTKIDADYVLNSLAEARELDIIDLLDDAGNLLPIPQWPKAWRINITGIDMHELLTGDIETIIKKIKWPDKIRILELIGKHIGVQAFSERRELTGPGGGPIQTSNPIDLSDLSKDERAALRRIIARRAGES